MEVKANKYSDLDKIPDMRDGFAHLRQKIDSLSARQIPNGFIFCANRFTFCAIFDPGVSMT